MSDPALRIYLARNSKKKEQKLPENQANSENNDAIGGSLNSVMTRRAAISKAATAGVVAVIGIAAGGAAGYVLGSQGKTSATSTTATTQATPQEPQSITINALAGFIESQATFVAQQYMKQHPGVTITVNPIPENNMNAETITGIQSGPPPDILYNSTLPAINAQIITPGYALNLDTYAANYGWDVGAIPYFDSFKVNGHYYWFPYGFIYYGNIYWNVDLFNKMNLQPPTTPDAFATAAKALKAAGLQPMAHGYQTQPEWTFNAFSNIAMNLLSDQDYTNLYTYYGQNLKTSDFANRPIKFTDSSVVSAFQTLVDWAPYYNDGVTSTTDSTAVSLFTSQQAGMYQIGSWGAVALEQPINGAFKFDFVPISAVAPPTNGGGPTRICFYGLPYFVHYKTKSPNLCADFLSSFLTPASQVYQLSAGGFLAFPIAQLSPNVSTDPNVQKDINLSTQLAGRYSLAAGLATELHDPFEAQLAGILSGSTTATQAAQAIEQLAISVNQGAPSTSASTS